MLHLICCVRSTDYQPIERYKDEQVLLLMCKLIDWESLGFEIVGMASDGMHALETVSYTHLYLASSGILSAQMLFLSKHRR